jgi:hypothetical protein
VQFSVDLMQYKSYAEWVKLYFQRDKQIATDFIKDVQKEYNLKDE